VRVQRLRATAKNTGRKCDMVPAPEVYLRNAQL
jgi:hypothetical protein